MKKKPYVKSMSNLGYDRALLFCAVNGSTEEQTIIETGGSNLQDRKHSRCHINELYRNGRKRETYRLRDVATLEYGTRRRLTRKSGGNMNTLRTLGNGGTVIKETAERIADALGEKLKDVLLPKR